MGALGAMHLGIGIMPDRKIWGSFGFCGYYRADILHSYHLRNFQTPPFHAKRRSPLQSIRLPDPSRILYCRGIGDFCFIAVVQDRYLWLGRVDHAGWDSGLLFDETGLMIDNG